MRRQAHPEAARAQFESHFSDTRAKLLILNMSFDKQRPIRDRIRSLGATLSKPRQRCEVVVGGGAVPCFHGNFNLFQLGRIRP